MEGREKVPCFALNLTRSLDESVRSLLSCRRPAGGRGRGEEVCVRRGELQAPSAQRGKRMRRSRRFQVSQDASRADGREHANTHNVRAHSCNFSDWLIMNQPCDQQQAGKAGSLTADKVSQSLARLDDDPRWPSMLHCVLHY